MIQIHVDVHVNDNDVLVAVHVDVNVVHVDVHCDGYDEWVDPENFNSYHNGYPRNDNIYMLMPRLMLMIFS